MYTLNMMEHKSDTLLNKLIVDLTVIVNQLDLDIAVVFGVVNQKAVKDDYNETRIYVGHISAEKALEVLEEFEQEGYFVDIIRHCVIVKSNELKALLSDEYYILKDKNKTLSKSINLIKNS